MALDSEALERLRERCARLVLESSVVNCDLVLQVSPDRMAELGRFLRDDSEFLQDFPADLTAYDTGEKLVLWYRLWSMSRGFSVQITAELEREAPSVPSVTSVWPGMNWHERECFDMYGIRFDGHPDQANSEGMRILLPEDWVGHPFRRDYEPVFAGDPLHGPQERN